MWDKVASVKARKFSCYIEGVSKKRRLGSTVYYAGSEHKLKIREMIFRNLNINVFEMFENFIYLILTFYSNPAYYTV